MDILAALVDEDLEALEKSIEAEQSNSVDYGLAQSQPTAAEQELSHSKRDTQAVLSDSSTQLAKKDEQTKLIASSTKSAPEQPPPAQAQSTSSSSSRLREVDVFGNASDGVASSSEVHTGLTDYESSDDEFLTSTGKEVNKIIKNRETEKRKKENPFKPHMSSSEQSGWSKTKVADTAAKSAPVQTDPFSGIRVRNPVISSDALRAKMGGRKMIKIPSIGSYLHKMKNQEEDWVTIGVVIHKSDPKSSNKSGKLFSIIKLNDLQNLETSVQLFLFNDVHMELWQRLRVGRVIGLLNAKMLPNREGSQDTSVSIDHPGKLLELGDAQDYGTCQGRTRAGQKCSNVVNKLQCGYCVFHVKAEFQKMASMRPEIQSSYSGAEPNRLRKAVFESTGGVYGVPKGMVTSMTKAEIRASLRPTGSTNAERKKREQLILSSLELKRKADADLENMAKKKPSQNSSGTSAVSSQSGRSDVADEFIETQLKTNGPGARLMRIALGREQPPSNVQKLPNGVMVSKAMSPGELLRQHAYRKQVMAMTPTLSGSPGGMVSLGGCQSKEDSKSRAARILKKSPIVAEDPNAVKRCVNQRRVLEKVKESNEQNKDTINGKEQKGDGSRSECSQTPMNKRIVLGREVDDEEVKKMLARKSNHQHEVDEAEDAAKAAYFAKLERKEALEQKMLSTMSVKVKVVSCPTCRYTAVTASEYCQKEGHATKTHDATKRFFRCIHCKNRTVSFCKLPSKPCKRCNSEDWERVAMWSEREGPKMDYEVLHVRGEEKKFIDSI
ncbi:protein MCM10-like [Tropilaelaps mercedesae]|uniref:Protein MCM10 homolog n=1 Tax=Tropilaelaps mercedesae TaxID=418985 RepID=A0A1V9X4Z2_9ACAR|nr:protein MCM10-like [Tropilaelaps mercedesae]